MKNNGFTLIEVIIYIALFSIMMSGLITVAFQLIQNSNKLILKDSSQEEVNFILKKLDWALINAKKINFSSSDPSILEIEKNDYSNNPIIFKLNSSDSNYHYIELCLDGIDCDSITSKNITIENFIFTHIPQIRKSPNGIKLEMKINNININVIKYLRI